jgi:RNA polymerase sigma factor (TIGR02999 family)
MPDQEDDITRLVSAWSQGEPNAFNELMELVYDDLRRIAHRHIRDNDRDGVVDTTMLVHEAYLKLVHKEHGEWEGRAQFFAFCSKAMRHILIDFARARLTQKRGGGAVRVPIMENLTAVDADAGNILAVEEALKQLEVRSPRMARVVECRFFGGMSVSETAAALLTSKRTVEREWTRARAYLATALGPPPEGNPA